ncbi:MAG: glycosyl-4,4'-diaponeurosporenoate acyltransferase [Brevinematia bacterium]
MKEVLFYILINSLFWIIIHFLSGFIVHLIPSKFYKPQRWLFKKRWWEFDGKLYTKLFLVKKWKDKVPEAGELFKINPFSKKNLKSLEKSYLKRFLLETCRAELSHLLPILFFPLCIPWNPGIAKWIMLAYALFANFPFIIIQRYNRIRLEKILKYNKLVLHNSSFLP